MTAREKEFSLTHIFKNVANFEEGVYHYSDVKEHFNIPWKFGIARKNGFISHYLYCEKEYDPVDWSIETERKVRFMAMTGKSEIWEIKGSYSKKKETNATGCEELVKWDEMEKNYLVEGNLTVENHVKIKKMTGIERLKLQNFDATMENFSDVILVVDEEKFYVSKLFLAKQSTYFDALFLRNFQESEKSEVILTGIDSEEFQNFLELLYGESPIDEDTIDGIVHLADMYDAKTAIRKSEDFLIEKSEKSLKEKLKMAKRYNLDNLKNKCLAEISKVDEIRSVLAYDLDEMDPTVVSALLQKTLSLVPKTN